MPRRLKVAAALLLHVRKNGAWRSSRTRRGPFYARVGLREIIESPLRHVVVDCLPSRLALELSTHRGERRCPPVRSLSQAVLHQRNGDAGLTGVEVGLQFFLGNEAAGLSVDRLQRANVELLVERHCQNLA